MMVEMGKLLPDAAFDRRLSETSLQQHRRTGEFGIGLIMVHCRKRQIAACLIRASDTMNPEPHQ